MRALSTELRRRLESAVLDGRHAAEAGARAALATLGVHEDKRPAHLTDDEARLRVALRAKQRQLGDNSELLVWDAAYEQWHRLLFARFLAENGLLRHPDYDIPITLTECEELAPELGEPDGWAVAARFAAQILPGIFKLDDPCVQLRLAPEHRAALEEIITAVQGQIFTADDSLGWVYQYWQSERKAQVNASEVKIGGADLGPVTQLFTEHYMVRFLLENSLGAWWAARHPNSPLLTDFEYLRYNDDGAPAAGTFDTWPDNISDVTVMDPCCGSGHFLTEAFTMLWHMRAEEEGLDPIQAQDTVLQDNLYGLELDPRCVQIAMFNVALTAWKQGNGWRELPTPNIACSGIPAKAPLAEWTALANGDDRLERALQRLHTMFKNADTLGSLIDPRSATQQNTSSPQQGSLTGINFEDVAPLLEQAAQQETNDPTTTVLGTNAAGIARAANLLSRNYMLVATNPPFLGIENANERLASSLKTLFPRSMRELALSMLERCRHLAGPGFCAMVLPSEWTYARAHRDLRKWTLSELELRVVAWLGQDSFTTPLRVNPILVVLTRSSPHGNDKPACLLDVSESPLARKPARLQTAAARFGSKDQWASSTDSRITYATIHHSPNAVALGDIADARNGLSAGDGIRFERHFWEICTIGEKWQYLQTSPSADVAFSGMDTVVLWEYENGSIAALAKSVSHLNHAAQNWRRGKPLWGRRGIVVSKIGAKVSAYLGHMYDSGCIAVVPNDPSHVGLLLAFARSGQLRRRLSVVNPTWWLGSPKTLLQLRVDLDEMRAWASEHYPNGLPEPHSNDPTQWLFKGRPEEATQPLQVAIARLLNYQWPEQDANNDLSFFADEDGIACLPAVRGEAPAADRLQTLLAHAYGDHWTPSLIPQLLDQAGSKKTTLTDWLRDGFFKHHCKTFNNRPFIWHIWDGRKDGFAALVNYHHLNLANLEKLTYTYLGDWIERQQADARDNTPGADLRLAAAEKLKTKLEAILEGEPPYDIYIRWKPLHEQPIGWDPNLDDGLRLNIRPFVEAGILRSRFTIHWKKDRGKNPDGTERHNDKHHTRDEKLRARNEAGK